MFGRRAKARQAAQDREETPEEVLRRERAAERLVSLKQGRYFQDSILHFQDPVLGDNISYEEIFTALSRMEERLEVLEAEKTKEEEKKAGIQAWLEENG